MTFHRHAGAVVGALMLVSIPCVAEAQLLRGTVRDSASGAPIPGAIVTLLDSTGAGMTRNLSNETGLYRATLNSQARRVRIVRLGFRPRELVLPAGSSDVTLDVKLQSLPFLLTAVHVEAGRNCPRRADRGAALALLEQARAGLLATVVSRSLTPARMTRATYQRRFAANGKTPVHQSVRLDTVGTSTSSFGAAQGAREFVRDGFMREIGTEWEFYAPDAETLLDDGFSNGYCFHIMSPERDRPNQIGLGFRPGNGRRPQVEIEGAMWIDTVARALNDIEFRYTGLPREADALRPGGRVAFRDMGNGTALIDQWSLRLIGSRVDTVTGTDSHETLRRRPVQRLFAEEGGGELAHAAWPGGRTWDASLGTLRARAVTTAGTAATEVRLRLNDTDYEARSDSTGTITIPRLVPGPYRAEVVDSALATIDVAIPTALAFVVDRGETLDRTVVIPTPAQFVTARCESDRQARKADSQMLAGRVLTRAGDPVAGVSISLVERVGAVERSVQTPGYETGTDGMFEFCAGLRDGMLLQIRAARGKSEPVFVTVPIAGRVTVARVPWQ